jgi:very-short-patch-repair endonuclease
VELDDLLRRQGRVVTRAQLRAAGVSARQLSGAERRLVRVRQGVDTDHVVADLTPRELAVLHVRAARLTSRVDLVAAGATAALVHGLPLLGPRPVRPCLVERKQERPGHHGASTTLGPTEVVDVGVPVTSPARTAFDVARARGHLAGVLVADAVLANGVRREALELVLVGRSGWPGAEAARTAVAFADRRSESPLESLGRVRFAEQGLAPPQLQVVVADEDGPFARVDQCWEEHRTIAEADGALSYATTADLFAEKRREDRLRDTGFEVVRYTWDEALRRPDALAARVRRALLRSASRCAPAPAS